jgi:hypothetical protein
MKAFLATLGSVILLVMGFFDTGIKGQEIKSTSKDVSEVTANMSLNCGHES